MISEAADQRSGSSPRPQNAGSFHSERWTWPGTLVREREPKKDRIWRCVQSGRAGQRPGQRSAERASEVDRMAAPAPSWNWMRDKRGRFGDKHSIETDPSAHPANQLAENSARARAENASSQRPGVRSSLFEEEENRRRSKQSREDESRVFLGKGGSKRVQRHSHKPTATTWRL